MTIHARTIERRCTACGAHVTAVHGNGMVEFVCDGDGDHRFAVPANGIGTEWNALEELYDRSAPEGGWEGEEPSPIDRLCPLCGSIMRVELHGGPGARAVFSCAGPAVHSWEVAGAGLTRARLERVFDLVLEIGHCGAIRRLQ